MGEKTNYNSRSSYRMMVSCQELDAVVALASFYSCSHVLLILDVEMRLYRRASHRAQIKKLNRAKMIFRTCLRHLRSISSQIAKLKENFVADVACAPF